jgi:hypothetical protein
MKIGAVVPARRWLRAYLSAAHEPDPEAAQAYHELAAIGQK